MGSSGKVARAILSCNHCEAHTRVIGLYRAFYRLIPNIIHLYDIPQDYCEIRQKIRQYFYENARVEDVRVIDLLVMKGWMEYKEIDCMFVQKGLVYSHWCPTVEKKPTTFIGKFMNSNDPY